MEAVPGIEMSHCSEVLKWGDILNRVSRDVDIHDVGEIFQSGTIDQFHFLRINSVWVNYKTDCGV